MWDPKDDTTENLLDLVRRLPLSRMEQAFQEAAREELKRRGVEV